MLSKSYDEMYTAKTEKGGDDDPNNYPNPPKPNTPKVNGPNFDGDNPGGSSSSDPASRTNRGSFGNIHPNGISKFGVFMYHDKCNSDMLWKHF